MKVPLRYHPAFVLAARAFAFLVWGIALAVIGLPFHHPISLIAILTGGLTSVWPPMIEALEEKAAGDEYLRRKLSGRGFLSGRYWWLWLALIAETLLIFWLFMLASESAIYWFLLGMLTGALAGYPDDRARWQRLQRFAEEEQQTASLANGGTA